MFAVVRNYCDGATYGFVAILGVFDDLDLALKGVEEVMNGEQWKEVEGGDYRWFYCADELWIQEIEINKIVIH